GDDGSTALAHNRRVRKTHPRVEAYGTVDELSAAMGVARACAQAEALKDFLRSVQADLLQLGGALAVDDADVGKGRKSVEIVGEDVARLDEKVAELESHLPPLRSFVLPGESLLSAHLHLARTICRRTERRVVELAETGAQVEAPI